MKTSIINQFPEEIIFFGGTGQAKVVRPIIEYYGSKVVAVFDDTPKLQKPFQDIPLYLGNEFKEWIQTQRKLKLGFCVTIGNPHGRLRIKLHHELEEEGLTPITLAHPTAFISQNAKIGVGSQIMAGSIIGPEVELGQDCIINTNANVDHESFLESGVEIGCHNPVFSIMIDSKFTLEFFNVIVAIFIPAVTHCIFYDVYFVIGDPRSCHMNRFHFCAPLPFKGFAGIPTTV